MSDDRLERLEHRVTQIGGIVSYAIAISAAVVTYRVLPDEFLGRLGFSVVASGAVFIAVLKGLEHLFKIND